MLVCVLFINFRTGDGDDKAAWLDMAFCSIFDNDQVFFSSRSLPAGRDYEPRLWKAVDECDAMIAVIGDRWLTEFGAQLDDPEDTVRREIARALAAGKPVIPVFGRMTRRLVADQLPPDLKALANLQFERLDSRAQTGFQRVLDRVIETVPELGIGVRPGIDDLAKWHLARTSLTNPVLPAEFPLLGREDIADKVRSWLAGPPGNLTIHGPTVDEVAAFAAAVLNTHNPRHRAMLISSKAGWEHAARILLPFPAVVTSDEVPVAATQSARHVIIAQDGSGEPMLLPVPREKARDAFVGLGLPLHIADEYAGLARRSLRALVRRLSPNQARPPWATDSTSDMAVPLVLVSRWSASNSADHEIIAGITGEDYTRVERFAQTSTQSGDPLLHRSGSRWQLADPYDSWSQLASKITATDIKRFSDAVSKVLSELNPVLSLSDAEAPTAKIRGIVRTWSDDLRQGLAHGLARLGDAGNAMVAGDIAENHAARIVVDLLRQANEDRTGELWRSLSDVLPLLAEAAPRVFLEAVRRGTTGDAPPLRAMFDDQDGDIFSQRSSHTGLLWALEKVAWARDHSMLAILQLARLAEIDPGGRMSNRPSQSLVDLLTYQPVSPIPIKSRPSIINTIRRDHAAVGWRLLCDITRHPGFSMYPARPTVRQDWTADVETVTLDMAQACWDELFQVVLAGLEAEPGRWREYLPRISALPARSQELLLSALEAADLTALNPEQKNDLWGAANDVLNWVRSRAGDARPLTDQQIDRMVAFVGGIEPLSDPTRHSWLFTSGVRLPVVPPTDHEAHRAAVAARRCEIVTAELVRHGVDGLARLAAASKRGELVGETLALVGGDSVREEVLALIGTPFAAGWVWHRAHEGRADWINSTAELLPAEPAVRASFLLALTVELAFERLELEDQDVCALFWGQTHGFPFPTERTGEFFTKLLEHDCPEAALDGLSMAVHGSDPLWRPPDDLVFAAFQGLLNARRQLSADTADAVESLLDHLHNTGHDPRDLVKWEVLFAAPLDHRRPHALLEVIAADPAVFVELHQVRFLSAEKLNPRAIHLYMTAERLRCVPGQTGDQVDRDKLLGWVQRARELLAEVGLQRTGDKAIGRMISAGPVGQDGAWPAEAVREVLDLPDADDVRIGFGTGLFNDRGTTFRGMYDGGGQERASATQYVAWAEQIQTERPYAALVLRDHARSLEAMGQHWDRESRDDEDE